MPPHEKATPAPGSALPGSKPSSPSILRSVGIVTLMTLISRVTGVVVQVTISAMLGATRMGDAYQVAWRLPNMLRRFTAEGTMTAAFLPTLTEVEAREGEAGATAFVSDFMGSLAWILGILCLVGILFMAPIVGLLMLGKLAPGLPFLEQLRVFSSVLLGKASFPPDVALAEGIARLMFPYLVMVSLTACMAAVLNLRNRFALAASMSTFWNLTFLGASWTCFKLGPRHWHEPQQAAIVFACAVLLGGLVQFLVLLPAFRRYGFRLGFRLRLQSGSVRLALKRMGPGLLAGGIHPINVLVSTSLASQLGYGAQVVLNNSNILGELVLGLFAMSFATVSLPAMSRQAAEGDLPGLRSNLSTALRGTAFLAIPAAVGLAVLAHPISAFLFQRGRFTPESVNWLAETLPYQALGILFIATVRISNQALNALKDYRSPAQAAVLQFTCNIVFSLLLMKPLGTRGMALANGLSAMVGLLYLEWRLRHALGQLPYRQVLTGWLTFGLGAAGMGLLALFGGRLVDVFIYHGFRGTGLRLFPLMAVASLGYFGLVKAMRVQEAEELSVMVRRKLGLTRRSL